MWYLYFRRITLGVFAAFISCCLAVVLVICNFLPAKAETTETHLEFPFLVPGTDLIAEFFVSYEGDFIEDQSGEFLINSTALCVYNRGDSHIEFASIQIEMLSGVYCFEATCIPPHAKVIILEKYKQPYPRDPICCAEGKMHISEKGSILEQLDVVGIDMGDIEVTNRSDKVMENVLLYYKRFDSQWGIYIGGITYAISAGDLNAGESIVLSPSRFANGYTKVLYATTK